MRDEEDPNALAWYVGYRLVSPVVRAVETWMRLRFWWRSR